MKDLTRVSTHPETIARLLREVANAHHEYEKQIGKPDANWERWYSRMIFNRLYGNYLYLADTSGIHPDLIANGRNNCK